MRLALTRLLLLTPVFIFLSAAHAQRPAITYSPGFEETEGVGCSLVQTRLGTTLLLNFTKREGIEVTAFSAAGRKLGKRIIKGRSWKTDRMAKSSVLGVFDVGSNTAIFLEQVNLSKPELYRILVNSETGALVAEEKIAEMEKYGLAANYVMIGGGYLEGKSFYVQNDPVSDCYAVVAYDNRAGKDGKRLVVRHYDSTNTLLSEAECEPPAEEYKLTRYIAMDVDGPRGLLIALYCSEGRMKSDPAKVFISRLKPGDKSFEHFPLPGFEDPQTTWGVMRRNRVTGKVMLLTMTLERSRGKQTYYSLLLSAIDPEDPTRSVAKQLTAESIAPYKKKRKSDAKPYGGVPQNMIVADDGSTYVAFEELATVTVSRGNYSYTYSKQGDVGIIRLGADGAETGGYLVRRKEDAPDVVPFMSHPAWKAGKATFTEMTAKLSNRPGFTDFDCIAVGSKVHVLLNSNPKNFELSMDEEPKPAQSVAQTEGIFYTLSGSDGVEKEKLFGGVVEDRTNKLMLTRIGSYRPDTRRYAVLIGDRSAEKEGKLKIAWLQFP